jgi:toxin-antitoxin system PIN domain toxin
MTGLLLDVNILIALFWPAHEFHTVARRWFARNSQHAWATCTVTQAGFVRIVSNPAFSRDAVSPEQAMEVLEGNLQHPRHQFWKDQIGFVETVRPFAGKMLGHRQVTDAYLLGLAFRHGGALATLDRGIEALLPDQNKRGLLEMVD